MSRRRSSRSSTSSDPVRRRQPDQESDRSLAGLHDGEPADQRGLSTATFLVGCLLHGGRFMIRQVLQSQRPLQPCSRQQRWGIPRWSNGGRTLRPSDPCVAGLPSSATTSLYSPRRWARGVFFTFLSSFHPDRKIAGMIFVPAELPRGRVTEGLAEVAISDG